MGRALEHALEHGCPKCERPDTDANPIDEQYSFGVYAGVMCRACAIASYRDGCGHIDSDLTIADLDEPYWEEE